MKAYKGYQKIHPNFDVLKTTPGNRLWCAKSLASFMNCQIPPSIFQATCISIPWWIINFCLFFSQCQIMDCFSYIYTGPRWFLWISIPFFLSLIVPSISRNCQRLWSYIYSTITQKRSKSFIVTSGLPALKGIIDFLPSRHAMIPHNKRMYYESVNTSTPIPTFKIALLIFSYHFFEI